LNQVNKYFHVQAGQSEVLSAWAGIRTLKSNGDFVENCLKSAPEYQIYSSPSGLITVLGMPKQVILLLIPKKGGKWTTFRKMSEEAVDVIIESNPHVLSFSNMFKPSVSTKNMTLIGNKLFLGGHNTKRRERIHPQFCFSVTECFSFGSRRRTASE
jgi:glycerol-3-phosphate dehydrogenase